MPCQPLRAPTQVAALTGEREGLIDQVASSQERLADLEARDAELGWVIVLSYWRMGHGCVWKLDICNLHKAVQGCGIREWPKPARNNPAYVSLSVAGNLVAAGLLALVHIVSGLAIGAAGKRLFA